MAWELAELGATGIVVPRSKTPSHMAENLKLLDWQLAPADAATLDQLKQEKVYNNVCQPW